MLLQHGTTRERAEAILANGPDANYREGNNAADGFFVVPAGIIPDDELGSATSYARAKATNNDFADEGGPAILEFELSDDQISALVGGEGELVQGKALNARLEIGFQPDGGLEELLEIWPTLKKQILLVSE